eukprot:g2696.t1
MSVPKSEGDVDLYLHHANGVPLTASGKVLHLELGAGDVANNIVTVGSEGRGEILASLLTETTVTRSKRGFVTHTGKFNGVAVSVILINMGYPNMDFLVREVRAVTAGPLRIIRLGSCAGLRPDLPVGTVAVASEGSLLVSQNPDAWATAARTVPANNLDDGESSYTCREPYVFHGVAEADEGLSNALLDELKRSLGEERVVGCRNASADSFYSSQGRLDSSFEDRNEDLIQSLLAQHPTAGSFEMETFQLLHLARLCRKSTVHATAASIVLASRVAGDAIAVDKISQIERAAGEAALRAVTSFDSVR